MKLRGQRSVRFVSSAIHPAFCQANGLKTGLDVFRRPRRVRRPLASLPVPHPWRVTNVLQIVNFMAQPLKAEQVLHIRPGLAAGSALSDMSRENNKHFQLPNTVRAP